MHLLELALESHKNITELSHENVLERPVIVDHPLPVEEHKIVRELPSKISWRDSWKLHQPLP